MNGQTRVKRIKVNERQPMETEKNGAQWVDYSQPSRRASVILQADRLIRNLAVAGGLLLVVVAVKNASDPQAQSVFSALKTGLNTEWDESVGKLSFVDNLLPEGIREVWSEKETLRVREPMAGETVHAWTVNEPYIEVLGTVTDVRAVADGEIMSVAHGMEEERIVRVRHDDGTEAVYGNLLVCYHDVGDRLYTGDTFARVKPNEPLAFEIRKDGRSINPEGLMTPQAE